jgi:Protein of unknown function (DUF2865)
VSLTASTVLLRTCLAKFHRHPGTCDACGGYLREKGPPSLTTYSNIGAALVTVASLTWGFAAYGEDAYEIMTGRVVGQSYPSPSRVLAYGENPSVQLFPPKNLVRPVSTETTRMNSYCVRTCDGRYFPVSSGDNQSRAEGCKSLCPASETRLFSGNSIENAYSKDGKSYSALPNAFRYRKELVPGCTCSGKDVIGLASIKAEDDKTLRRGDMVATKDGLEVVNSVSDGRPGFAAASKSIRNRFERPPVLASQ